MSTFDFWRTHNFTCEEMHVHQKSKVLKWAWNWNPIMKCCYANLKNHNFSPTLLVKKWLYLVNAQILGLGRPSSRAHCDQESWPIFDFLIANERFLHKLQVISISYWAVAWSCGRKLAKCRFLVIFRGVITQNHSITSNTIFSKSPGYFF